MTRKTAFFGVLLAVVLIAALPDRQAADPVRVTLGTARFAFPAQLLPRVATGGAAEPGVLYDHWYRRLRTPNGAGVSSGYLQGVYDADLSGTEVQLTGEHLAALDPEDAVQLAKLDFITIAHERGSGPAPSLDRFCAELKAAKGAEIPGGASGFVKLEPLAANQSAQVWVSRDPLATMTCSSQLPMIDESWGLACYYMMPISPDIWLGGRLFDRRTRYPDWVKALTLLDQTVRSLALPQTLPKLPHPTTLSCN